MNASDDLRGAALYDRLMALRPADLVETDWAEQAGVNRSFFSNLKGKNTSPRADTLRKMLAHIGRTEADLYGQVASSASTQGRSEAGHRSDRPEQPRTRTVDNDEVASVTRLDLSYSMGSGIDLDSSYVDNEEVKFGIGFLRSMTITPPERIRIVDGIGDSMTPTIHDRDLLFVDINQGTLNAQDRIWAIWLFGMGAVKRLRAIDGDRVMVISDNPDVENQVVNRTDIIIHGRVVGSIRRH